MDNLERVYSDLIKYKYIGSPVQELSLNLINRKIKEIEDEIDKIVHYMDCLKMRLNSLI